MTDLDKALDAARDALDNHDYGHEIPAYVVRNLLSALDAARGEAVATVQTITSLVGETRKCIIGPAEVIDSLPVGTAVYAAPPAALADEVTDEHARAFHDGWLACKRGDAEPPRPKAPPAALAVPAASVTPMRQPRTDLARLVESIKAAVYANGDGLSVTEAIGALELDKLELFKEQEK